MFYEKEKIEQFLYCSYCGHQFSDVVKLIPECGNSICGECEEELRDELEKLPAQYTCKACEEEGHMFPAKGLPTNKGLMNLVKTAPSERPLSEQAKKLREILERVDEEIKRLGSFNPEQYIREHFEQMKDQVCEAAESAVKHIKEIERELLRDIDERCQQYLASHVARLSAELEVSHKPTNKLQQEASEFILKWNDFFQKAGSYASDQDIESALAKAQSVLDEIEIRDKFSKLEANDETMIQFEANNLFLQTKDHLGKLAAFPIEPIKYQGPSQGEDT